MGGRFLSGIINNHWQGQNTLSQRSHVTFTSPCVLLLITVSMHQIEGINKGESKGYEESVLNLNSQLELFVFAFSLLNLKWLITYFIFPLQSFFISNSAVRLAATKTLQRRSQQRGCGCERLHCWYRQCSSGYRLPKQTEQRGYIYR